MVHEAEAKASLDAQHAKAGLVVRVIQHGYDAVVLVHLRQHSAADAAVGTGGGNRLCYFRKGRLHLYGAGGADRQALAACGADRLHQRQVHEGADLALGSRSQHIDGADELVAVLAGLHAALAEDAAVHGDVEHRTAGVRLGSLAALPARLGDAVLVRGYGQLSKVFTAAVLGKHGQRQFQNAPAHGLDLRRVGPHLHAVGCRHGARRRVAARALYVYKTGAASPDGLHIRVLA